MFPENFVAFPAFLPLLNALIQRLSDDWSDFSQLYPWIVLNKKTEVYEKRKENTDYDLYVTLLESLIQYITILVPNRIKKVEELRQRQKVVFKKYGKSDVPSYKKLEDEIHLIWFQVPNASGHSSEMYGFSLHLYGDEQEFLRKTLIWIFIKCDLASPNVHADNLTGFLSVENSRAWDPLFAAHITNKNLCEWTHFGQRIISGGRTDYKHLSIVTEECHFEYASDFECFHSSRTLSLWIKNLKHYKYERSVAREFFGHTGFFSHLYNELLLDLDPKNKLFKDYIENIVLPQFDTEWLAE